MIPRQDFLLLLIFVNAARQTIDVFEPLVYLSGRLVLFIFQ
jgi:hypothetical protein